MAGREVVGQLLDNRGNGYPESNAHDPISLAEHLATAHGRMATEGGLYVGVLSAAGWRIAPSDIGQRLSGYHRGGRSTTCDSEKSFTRGTT